ncbi:MAG: hypothetical protein K2F91_01930 [Muribaculaceae bacterium]|nr:hypothetical protein [Muribaculaceae bacterium]MDE6196607.1 hypothetical protein [Muribaculaceae bacterium]
MINLPPFPNEPVPDWRGLTLREIEMRRALVQARMEIQKFKMSAHVDGVRQRTPFFGGPQSLFSRLSGAFTIAEYGFFAMKAFKLISPLFRKRR